MSKQICGKCIHINVCYVPRTLGCVDWCDNFCKHNDGTVQTNEEWFCGLSTEEKAKWLYTHYVNARAEEFYDKPEKTLCDYQKWLVDVHK